MLIDKKALSLQIWISCLITLVIVFIILPIYISSKTIKPVVPTGVNIKNGDRIFTNYIANLKKNKGVLILGTSETGNKLNGNNYWNLLQNDSELNRSFYSLGGAGRCSYVYFPLIIDQPELFENLEVILYINPTYWRKGLNKFNDQYYNRYVNSALAKLVKYKAIKQNLYTDFMEPGIKNQSATNFAIDRLIENFRSLYYSDLNNIVDLNFEKNRTQEHIISIEGAELLRQKIQPTINSDFNATNEYLKADSPFPAIDTLSDFQDKMLISFIELAKKYNINCTYYLGPVNTIYCKKQNKDLLENHLKAIENIKSILEKNNLNYIDGSYQGEIPGSFIDVQHISEYGAYLTALDIKNNYEKVN